MGENLFEEEFTIDALSQMGNPIERLAALVDFEMFSPALEEVLVKKDCSQNYPTRKSLLTWMVATKQCFSMTNLKK